MPYITIEGGSLTREQKSEINPKSDRSSFGSHANSYGILFMYGQRITR